MRLLRRNALGVYAVYAAAIVSGLVVTPIVIHTIGTPAFGVWSFIGSVTIYLAVLDFGVAPSIIRFAAEARGRKAVDELNAIASTGLALYAAIGLVTLPVGLAIAWIVPAASGAPPGLVWDARLATFLVVLSLAARFPLGLFNNLIVAQQRWDLQNLANFVSTVLYAMLVVILLPKYGGIVLLASLTLGTTILKLALPLLWIRRVIPELRIRSALVSRQTLRTLVSVSSSNFLVHIAQKIVFSTDVIVVAIVLGSARAGVYSVPAKLFALAFGIGTAVTSFMFPAFAELEGAGASDRQRRLLLSGIRAGTALMLLLALPLLLMPDVLIHAWIGSGFGGAYSVMAILAGVLLVHQPIFVLTQFLIARALQRQVALVSICTTLTNLGLSFLLASIWGIWGVAVSTLATDIAALVWLVPIYAAPAAGVSPARLARAIVRPVGPALVVAGLVLVLLVRVWHPDTLLPLATVGVIWTVLAAAGMWFFGLAGDERTSVVRELRGRSLEPASLEG